MKKIILSALIAAGLSQAVSAQTQPADVNKIVQTEVDFNNLVARKGIKSAFLSVADPEGIVFKPSPVKISEFYSTIDKQPGKLSWEPKFARISANGDLGFTAGPFVYQNGKTDDDKVFGEYVSIWKRDASDNKYKLMIDLGIQHPEPDNAQVTDFKEADPAKQKAPSKDPFNGKTVILTNDKLMNHSLDLSALAAYKEFLSPEARFYFPGFEPMTGTDKILKFLDNEGVTISAETINAGRSESGDLAYSYGKASIRKGNIVNRYHYVRIWEINETKKWNMVLEIFSTVE